MTGTIRGRGGAVIPVAELEFLFAVVMRRLDVIRREQEVADAAEAICEVP